MRTTRRLSLAPPRWRSPRSRRAETALARARVEVVARYDYSIARVVLSRAVGELPDFSNRGQ